MDLLLNLLVFGTPSAFVGLLIGLRLQRTDVELALEAQNRALRNLLLQLLLAPAHRRHPVDGEPTPKGIER